MNECVLSELRVAEERLRQLPEQLTTEALEQVIEPLSVAEQACQELEAVAPPFRALLVSRIHTASSQLRVLISHPDQPDGPRLNNAAAEIYFAIEALECGLDKTGIPWSERARNAEDVLALLLVYRSREDGVPNVVFDQAEALIPDWGQRGTRPLERRAQADLLHRP